MLKGLGDLGKMGTILKQAMEMKQRIEELKEKLAEERVEFSVAGEVSVVFNGNMELISLKINPDLLKTEDIETIEGIVCAAVNGGLQKVRDMVKTQMAELTGNVEIPGLF